MMPEKKIYIYYEKYSILKCTKVAKYMYLVWFIVIYYSDKSLVRKKNKTKQNKNKTKHENNP